MKTITIIAITAALAPIGCKNPPKRTDADYVREHHCTTDGVLRVSHGTIIVVDGKERALEGQRKPYYAYTCPNGVDVFIDYDEDHPFTDGKAK